MVCLLPNLIGVRQMGETKGEQGSQQGLRYYIYKLLNIQ